MKYLSFKIEIMCSAKLVKNSYFFNSASIRIFNLFLTMKRELRFRLHQLLKSNNILKQFDAVVFRNSVCFLLRETFEF